MSPNIPIIFLVACKYIGAESYAKRLQWGHGVLEVQDVLLLGGLAELQDSVVRRNCT
jgi:hypothetical protein